MVVILKLLSISYKDFFTDSQFLPFWCFIFNLYFTRFSHNNQSQNDFSKSGNSYQEWMKFKTSYKITSSSYNNLIFIHCYLNYYLKYQLGVYK